MTELREGWQLVGTSPGAIDDPSMLDGLGWTPTTVPGRAPGSDPDAHDWWWRTTLTASDDDELVFDGIATVCDVYLNGQLVAHNESMFQPVRIPLAGRLRAENELAVCCRALGPLLAVRRKPRARWRTALVSEGNLRFYRTMLLGRAPGFAPGPPLVGVWRPVRIETPSPTVTLRTRIEGENGILSVTHGSGRVEVSGPTGVYSAEVRGAAEIVIPGVARWWPHTHGEPVLYDVTVDGRPAARVGFRELTWPDDWESAGLALMINDVDVFARGAVWTPVPENELRTTLEQVVAGGLNMVRVPGIGCYESTTFHDLCDELGILVWQDFMFANLDYPDQDPEFMEIVEQEARREVGRLASRPSLGVLCGGSECAQQVTMLGLDPDLARGPLYTELLPRVVAESGAGVPYVPNSPWGGDLPFRPDRGVANYYGVGAYLRPLSDARLADVKFAAECLAFSNVPEERALEPLGATVPHHPVWKSGIPRDVGTGWDFEDVRDHYLRLLYDEDPVAIRWSDVGRYLELSRSVTGEVMAEAFGEWRRRESSCAGALVLWLRDVQPGAGWGLLDHAGGEKVAYHHLRRALAPLAVWIVDEGLGGMVAHVANDGPLSRPVTLRVALYRDSEVLVDSATLPLVLAPRSVEAHGLESVIGRFVDITWAYRFGAPAQDVVAVSLQDGIDPGGRLLSQAFRFPAGRPRRRESGGALGVKATTRSQTDGTILLQITSQRLLHGARIDAAGFTAADDAFSVEPGGCREVLLTPSPGAAGPEPTVVVYALNLIDRVRATAL